MPEISVVMPTRNRPERLRRSIGCLEDQTLWKHRYELLVVDDGSDPSVVETDLPTTANIRVVRRAHGERSAARNEGAAVAAGHLLVFMDDDMEPVPGFLEAHLAAQKDWPATLSVGSVFLPSPALVTPFGRFRAALEQTARPARRGAVSQPNFCTAQNMSIPRSRFLELGGFDPQLHSGEDQELALRHSSRGGRIVFLPEARAVHQDQALDIRRYCQRAEWGGEHDVAFVRKQPDWPDNRHRHRTNGPLELGGEPARISLGKVSKVLLGFQPLQETLFLLTALLERVAPDSVALDRLYRILLGIHIRRGYMRGLRGLRALPSG